MRRRSRWYADLPNASRVYRDTVFPLAHDARRILDLGCGRMRLLRDLPTRGLRVGVDVVSLTADPLVAGVRGDATRLPFADASFDLVLSTSVLEHLTDPAATFREIARVLRPGGTVLVLTPNRWDYVSLVSQLIPNRWHGWIVQRVTGRSTADTFPTYYRANTPRALRRHAVGAQLTVTEVRGVREHPHYLRHSRVGYVLGTLIEQVLQRPLPVLRPWILARLTAPASL